MFQSQYLSMICIYNMLYVRYIYIYISLCFNNFQYILCVAVCGCVMVYESTLAAVRVCQASSSVSKCPKAFENHSTRIGVVVRWGSPCLRLGFPGCSVAGCESATNTVHNRKSSKWWPRTSMPVATGHQIGGMRLVSCFMLLHVM